MDGMVLGADRWVPFLSLISTIIGAAGAIAGGAFGSWLTWQKERQSVAGALAAEVKGILDHMERYQFAELISRRGSNAAKKLICACSRRVKKETRSRHISALLCHAD